MKYLFCLFLVFTTSAEAARDLSKPPVSFCTQAGRIVASIEMCEDNDLFLQQGENCLTALDNESKSVAGILPAGFSDNLSQKQKSKFGSANQDYKATSASLAYLIAVTNTAIGEIKTYKENLALPPDSDEPDVTGGNVEGYAMRVDCYGTNKENLDSLLEDFDKRLGQLRSAKAIADASGLTSATRQQQVDASSTAPIIRGQGKPSGIPTGIPQNRDSDVTGIKENDAKKKPLK